MCGRAADPDIDGDPPLSWTTEIVNGSDGPSARLVCDICTRRYVRSIEAKLDREWW